MGPKQRGFPFLIFSVFILLQFTEATISKEQIQLVRQLPVSRELQDNLINHYDDVRDWIIDLTLTPAQPGRAFLPSASVECLACRIVLDIYIELMRTFDDFDWIIDLMKGIGCAAVDFIDYMHPDVCKGALDLFKNDLHFIVTNNSALQPVDVCTILIGTGSNCGGTKTPEFFNWTINIIGEAPEYPDRPYLPDTRTPVKILHLTDIHLDLDYAIGKNTDCGKPMCCQMWEADGLDEETSAGPHGDYHCDMPLSAMDELFEYSANMGDYDYEFVMMTGDIPPHNVWNTTLEGNLLHYQMANDKLIQLFRTARGVPIYPVFGNHEPHPCNLYPPKAVWGLKDGEFDKAWMYNAFADAYGADIQDPDAIAQLRETGYYTMKHKDTNLRIIVINTNFGYRLNFWLFYDLIDAQGQLQWLADRLHEAEADGEKVYILGHMPPGNGDCWGVWSANFEKIVVRYASIIMGQFYGHTHKDEIQIWYDSSSSPSNPIPVSSLFVGASTTALTNTNPGYKVYFVDGFGDEATWEIMDHETWVYNLTEANQSPNDPMPWKRLYRAKEDLGLKSLRPKDLDDFAKRMLFDEELFQKYYRHYHTDSHVVGGCDTEDCKMRYICDIVIANSNDYTHCERFRGYLDDGTTQTTTPSKATEFWTLSGFLTWVPLLITGVKLIFV